MRKKLISCFMFIRNNLSFLLVIFATFSANAQVITGTKTVCASGCDYTSLQAAATALNTNGVGTGGANILVASGHIETAPTGGIVLGSSTLNTSLSATNPLIIQKNGVGSNPTIQAFTGTGTTDGILKLLGTDFVTINGLEFTENVSNTNATTHMEWGIALLKRNATAPFDGCHNNTIQNCTIKLSRSNITGRGIYLNNHISNSTTTLAITTAADANSFNKIYNNNIDGAYYGVNLSGFAHGTAPFNLYDQGNEVGRDNLGNTITNFGGTTTLAYGIYSIYQNELHIIHNHVSGGGVLHTTTLYGIGASTSNGARTFIRKNTVIDTSTSTNYPIYMATGATGGRLYVDSNIVTGCTNHTGTGILYAIYSISTPDSLVVTNNKIVANKSTSTGAFYGIAHTSATGGISITDNNEISNNLRNGAFYGIYSFGTANIFSIKNNIISGDTTMGAASLLYGIWQTSTNNSTDSIIGNQINHLFANGSGAVIGYFKNSNTHSGTKFITHNTIYNLYSNTGSVRAINHPGGSSNRILQNNIFNIISNGTASQSIGIELGANSLNNVVANNFISEIKAPNSVNANGSALGVLISNGTVGNNSRLFFNTIFLDAVTNTTNLNSACVKSNTNPTLELRNNILINKSASGASGRAVCFWREGTNLTSYHATSNNNVYYTGGSSVGSAFFFNGTSADTNIADLKIRMGGRDGSSFSENVAFINSSFSPYNLRINAFVPTQLESGASPVSTPFPIQVDYDNNIRNNNAPDIGANEGTFIGIDLIGPNISFAAPGMQQISSSIGIGLVSINDPSGLKIGSTTRPRIYYKKKSEMNAISGNTSADNGWKYTNAIGAASPFNFTINTTLLNSALNVGDTIEYFIIAEDSLGNIGVNAAQFSFPPSSVDLSNSNFPANNIANSIYIADTISGTFTVGISGQFISITAALDTLQRRLITGPVVLNLVDPIYTNATLGGSEVFPIRLKKYVGISPTNTLTIKPAIGNNSLITGASGFAMFLFENGAEHIIIDGSNNGTDSRNLRLFNSIATQSTSIFIESNNPDLGVRDVTIKNTTIKGGNNATSYGILMAANIVLPHTSAVAGSGTRRILIHNNNIYNTYYGVVVKGSSANPLTNITISNNLIGSDSAGLHVQYFGIYLQSANLVKVHKNKIFNIRSVNSLNIAGIQLFNEVTNSTISNNEVSGVYQQSTGGWGAAGIDLNQNVGNINDSIYNNFISDILGINYSPSTIYNAFGLKIVGGIDIKVYHNSIHLFGSPSIGTTATASASVLLQVPGNGLDIRNNIFSNAMTGGIAGSKHYSLWITALPPSNAIFDNNNFFVSASDGVLMRNNTVDVTTMANLRTTLNSNTNSINVNPQFSSNTRLYPGVGTVAGLGSSISTITRDFVDTLRNIPPSIGAIEKEADLAPPIFTNFTPFPNTSSLLNRNVTVGIVDAYSGVAAASGSRPRIYFKKRSEANSFGANTNFVSGWKWVEANNTSSPFAFSIDYSLLFTALSVGDTIQYFIVAQDSIGNVGGIPELGLQLTTVGNITQAPNSPFQYIVTPSPLAGIYTVGALGNYTSISSAVGALNLLGVSDAVTFALIDTVYTLTTPVEIFNAAGVSAANTVTFRPAPGVNAKITGTINDVIFRIVGARHIRFIGYDSLSLPSINLTIENWGTGNTIAIRNDASNNTISYCKVSGSSTAAANAIIAMNTSINTGNNFNTIEYCILTPTIATAAPHNAIYMTGITAAPNTNNIVRNNYISNFINRGVFATTANNNLSISDNHFYQTIPRTATAAYAPIFVENSTGTNIQITNNYIGGSDSLCLGATPMTISGAQLMQLIFLQSAPSTWSNITGNKIANIHFTTTNATANHAFIFIGNGKVNCTNNEIGYDTSTNNIVFNYNGSGQSNLYGFGVGGVLAAPIFDSIIV
ncbi:MAG: right-handed parallel beta-helix repeat-containing protein, partial [Bacteroidota bacterium]|nr:right-handed parallel beta-helix repeat-containing protein [Bacteroidota bacterium]